MLTKYASCDQFTIHNLCKKVFVKWLNTSLVVKGALAHRLQRRTACKIQNGRERPQNGGRGSKQLSLNKFFDPSTPSMRKGRDGEEKKTGKKKKKRQMKIVATTSLPAVDRPNADRWNAARSRQLTEIFH